MLSARKLMATVFWVRKGVLIVEFMQQGTAITSLSVLRNTKKKLRRLIQNTRRGMLTSDVVLLHDTPRPHTATSTRVLLEYFNWELSGHPPYRPDLAPNDYLPEELVGITALQQQ
jgi:hypothetical protein